MSTILNNLWTVDWSKVPPHIMKGLETGEMHVAWPSGIVRNAAGGIEKHLSFVQVSAEEFASAEQLLQVGQAVNGAKIAAVSATAIGTAVVLVAVIVATAYLANKIDKVERSVNELAQTAGQQDQREFLKYMSDYAGLVMAARELLQPHLPQDEISGQAANQTEKLAVARQQLLGYVRQLPFTLEGANAAQQDRVFRFTIGVLDLMPAALAVERELCFAADKPVLAKTRCRLAASEFRQARDGFKKWCGEQYQLVALGKGGFVDVLVKHREALNALFDSPVHDLLLGDLNPAFAWDVMSASSNPEIAETKKADSNGQSRSN